MTPPSRRLDLSFLALDGDEVVGLVIAESTETTGSCRASEAATSPSSVSWTPWRRQGVAPALLAASLRAARDDGLERVVLDVDSENPTGALGLYTGMGFAADEQLACAREGLLAASRRLRTDRVCRRVRSALAASE